MAQSGFVNVDVTDIAPTPSQAQSGGTFGKVTFGAFNPSSNNYPMYIILGLIIGTVLYRLHKKKRL